MSEKDQRSATEQAVLRGNRSSKNLLKYQYSFTDAINLEDFNSGGDFKVSSFFISVSFQFYSLVKLIYFRLRFGLIIGEHQVPEKGAPKGRGCSYPGYAGWICRKDQAGIFASRSGHRATEFVRGQDPHSFRRSHHWSNRFTSETLWNRPSHFHLSSWWCMALFFIFFFFCNFFYLCCFLKVIFLIVVKFKRFAENSSIRLNPKRKSAQ